MNFDCKVHFAGFNKKACNFWYFFYLKLPIDVSAIDYSHLRSGMWEFLNKIDIKSSMAFFIEHFLIIILIRKSNNNCQQSQLFKSVLSSSVINTHGSVSVKFVKVRATHWPSVLLFTRIISSYFWPPPHNSQTIRPTHVEFWVSNKAPWNI